MPNRIQRSRAKGWRMPEGAVYVGRPSQWGNPFIIGVHGCAAECVRIYRLCVLSQERPGELTAAQLSAANEAWPDAFHMPCPNTIKLFLGGKDLACWCALSSPCHADVLIELANA